ncbi:capsular polysaccharide synthesis protein [Luteolibacter marinus]|uniref:capsular polysaccharide synthesis protein n=1 Tax=Luteolibacter marinus TaxID=2776705 RepID=UPI001869447E|nr:capsular polysaccharide synthesis protein [Luteolibacter marinus]
MFWDAGLNGAPYLVRKCHESWVTRNPDWEVEFLDAEQANAILDRSALPEGTLTAHYADVLRTRLLHEHGGVWADATSICNLPLNNWMPSIMLQADFFAFRAPRPGRVLSNWFLASKPGALIIRRWLEATEQFWSGRRRSTNLYYWHDFSFEWLCWRSRAFREEWAKTPNFSATPSHRLLKLQILGRDPDHADLSIIRHSFVHKLSWKEDFRRDVIDKLVNGGS